MSGSNPDLGQKPNTKVYALGCLGLTVFPVLLMIVGFILGLLLGAGDPAWNIVFWVWTALGIACGVPAIRAALTIAKGSNARIIGVVLGALGAIAGIGAAGFGFLMSGIGAAHGRPLRKRGRAVSAPAAPGEAWTGDVRPALGGLDPAVREALAAEWLEDARLEHASVAAFARLSLDLLAVGAPPALVDRCHHAASEEIAHARTAFALAGAYAGKPVGPGPFPEATEFETPTSPERTRARLAVEALVDGCVGEGAAAASLAEAAEACTDPAVAAALRATAREEADHAELSWDLLAWAVKAGGSEALREARRALDALALPDAPPPRWPADIQSALATNGRLPAARERAIRTEVIAATRARWERALS